MDRKATVFTTPPISTAELAYGSGLGPTGVKHLQDIANAIFGSTTEDTDAYHWCFDPKSKQVLVGRKSGGGFLYWNRLDSGEVAVVDHKTAHKTLHPAGSPLSEVTRTQIMPLDRPCMPPPSAVPAKIQGMYAVCKMFGDAVFGRKPDEALEYRWAIDPKYPGQLCIQDEASGVWRRVEEKSDGSFAIYCEQSRAEYALPRTHEVAQLMTKERSRERSHFAGLLEMARKYDWHRPTLQ